MMAKMMGRNLKRGLCGCPCCGGLESKGRSAEKREWQRQVEKEYDFGGWDAESVRLFHEAMLEFTREWA